MDTLYFHTLKTIVATSLTTSSLVLQQYQANHASLFFSAFELLRPPNYCFLRDWCWTAMNQIIRAVNSYT